MSGHAYTHRVYCSLEPTDILHRKSGHSCPWSAFLFRFHNTKLTLTSPVGIEWTTATKVLPGWTLEFYLPMVLLCLEVAELAQNWLHPTIKVPTLREINMGSDWSKPHLALIAKVHISHRFTSKQSNWVNWRIGATTISDIYKGIYY